MLENDILRNFSQNILGVPRGIFKAFGVKTSPRRPAGVEYISANFSVCCTWCEDHGGMSCDHQPSSVVCNMYN